MSGPCRGGEEPLRRRPSDAAVGPAACWGAGSSSWHGVPTPTPPGLPSPLVLRLASPHGVGDEDDGELGGRPVPLAPPRSRPWPLPRGARAPAGAAEPAAGV